MAMGQAAGIAAALSSRSGVAPGDLEVGLIQEQLIEDGAVLMYFQDTGPESSRFKALQKAAVRGFFGVDEWDARLDDPLSRDTAERWISLSEISISAEDAAGKTRREFLEMAFE